jgi:hypothetical protein
MKNEIDKMAVRMRKLGEGMGAIRQARMLREIAKKMEAEANRLFFKADLLDAKADKLMGLRVRPTPEGKRMAAELAKKLKKMEGLK